MQDIAANIFREYDIRGQVPSELNEEGAYSIARQFAQTVSKVEQKSTPAICVGWDGRLSSPALKDAISKGLSDGGADVLMVGLGPTPLAYYSVFKQNADGCIMITGSHNPPDYNGLKMMIGKRPFFGEQIQQLARDIEQENQPLNTAGEVHKLDLVEDYLSVLTGAAGPAAKPLKVVWDAGNGAAGEVVTVLAKRLPGEHEVLFGEIDGTFPNHHPDPSVDANMQDLKRRVLEVGADIGFAFDGDGDRIGVIDGQGRIWAGDQTLAICAEQVLANNPASEIIVDVKTSQGVIDHIAAYGGKPVIWKTGHSNIKSKLAETGAPLAGEMSGHMFFADQYYGIDDAIYAAMRLLNMLASSDKSAAEFYDALPTWHSTPEIRVECADDKKFTLIEQVAKQLDADGKAYTDIDGVRVQEADGWWLLRASNTQPVLVARAEAKNEEGLAALKHNLNHYLAPHSINL